MPEFEVGDEVFAHARNDMLGGVAFAEYVAVPACRWPESPRC